VVIRSCNPSAAIELEKSRSFHQRIERPSGVQPVTIGNDLCVRSSGVVLPVSTSTIHRLPRAGRPEGSLRILPIATNRPVGSKTGPN
jgi:hypothetical protein